MPRLAVVLGTFGFCVGFGLNYSSANFMKQAIEVEATVTEVEERRDDDGIFYRTTFEAITSNGENTTYVGNTWFSPKPHAVGEIVLAYLDPDTGVIRSGVTLGQTQSTGRFFMGLGGGFALFGLVCLGMQLKSSSRRV